MRLGKERGYAEVLEGGNADDLEDYRPGRSAVRELGVHSPLEQAGLTKEEIRELSRHFGLPTAEKEPSPCLASRFAYGDPLTSERLARVAGCERLLREAGFTQVRVRCHGDVARIEVAPAEIDLLIERKERLVRGIQENGFLYVALDLQGYRRGSANEAL